jgi:hypothetical protein
LARFRIHLQIGENNLAIAREHQTLIEELRNAKGQFTALSQPGFAKTSGRGKRT